MTSQCELNSLESSMQDYFRDIQTNFEGSRRRRESNGCWKGTAGKGQEAGLKGRRSAYIK